MSTPLSPCPKAPHPHIMHLSSMIRPDVYQCAHCDEVFDLSHKRTEPSKPEEYR